MMRATPDELRGHTTSASTRDLILSVAQALVDDTAAVNVLLQESDADATIILTVAPSDLGKVIGKQGRTARSMRTILQAASMKQQKRYSLDIRSHPSV
jgi:predicted RNA-binding protein YlqC (UPF0109 family)